MRIKCSADNREEIVFFVIGLNVIQIPDGSFDLFRVAKTPLLLFLQTCESFGFGAGIPLAIIDGMNATQFRMGHLTPSGSLKIIQIGFYKSANLSDSVLVSRLLLLMWWMWHNSGRIIRPLQGRKDTSLVVSINMRILRIRCWLYIYI